MAWFAWWCTQAPDDLLIGFANVCIATGIIDDGLSVFGKQMGEDRLGVVTLRSVTALASGIAVLSTGDEGWVGYCLFAFVATRLWEIGRAKGGTERRESLFEDLVRAFTNRFYWRLSALVALGIWAGCTVLTLPGKEASRAMIGETSSAIAERLAPWQAITTGESSETPPAPVPPPMPEPPWPGPPVRLA